MTDETPKPKLTLELVAAGIAERCYNDSDYRQRFIDNPKAFVEEGIGKKLSEEIEIIACENSDNKWYVPVPQDNGREISEEDLAKIAAGELGAMLGLMAVMSVVALGITVTMIAVPTGIIFGSLALAGEI